MHFYLQGSGGAKYSVWDDIQPKCSFLLNVNNKHRYFPQAPALQS